MLSHSHDLEACLQSELISIGFQHVLGRQRPSSRFIKMNFCFAKSNLSLQGSVSNALPKYFWWGLMTYPILWYFSIHLLLQGSLVCNMLMGYVFMRKRYSISKCISIALLTLGIYVSTKATVSNISLLLDPKQIGFPRTDCGIRWAPYISVY